MHLRFGLLSIGIHSLLWVGFLLQGIGFFCRCLDGSWPIQYFFHLSREQDVRGLKLLGRRRRHLSTFGAKKKPFIPSIHDMLADGYVYMWFGVYLFTDQVSGTHRYEYVTTSADDLIGAAAVADSSPAVDTIGMVGADDEGGVAVTGMCSRMLWPDPEYRVRKKKWATLCGAYCTEIQSGICRRPLFMRSVLPYILYG
jgi:hypothetical protein